MVFWIVEKLCAHELLHILDGNLGLLVEVAPANLAGHFYILLVTARIQLVILSGQLIKDWLQVGFRERRFCVILAKLNKPKLNLPLHLFGR